MPGNTSWIPSIIIWSIASIWLISTIVYWLKNKRKKQREDKPFSQISDLEMGKHVTRIRELLTIFKNELLAKVSEEAHVSNLQVNVEKQRGFYQVWEHCPSINKAGLDLRLSRILYEAKLKSNSVVDEDDSHIKERMKALADAIDNCLSDGEYLGHSCSNCIEKRNQLSGISKTSNPALAQSKDFAIQWVKESNYFERFIGETDTPIQGVNCYIVFKPMRGRITVESLWLDIAGKIARTSGEWTTETFVRETTHNLQFDIPPNIPRGERTVKLVAIVDGSEVVCDEFTIDIPLER